MKKPQAIFSWSGGKDSALSFYEASKTVEIVALLSTVSSTFKRIAIHGVREEILDLQAAAMELPCIKAYIPSPCSNEEYEKATKQALIKARNQGITHVVCGDINLQEARSYREEQCVRVGMSAMFPLWDRDSKMVAHSIISTGIKANIACLDADLIDENLLGMPYELAFLEQISSEIDPCGENGEFHTLVSYAPMFTHPLKLSTGVKIRQKNYAFIDFLPV